MSKKILILLLTLTMAAFMAPEVMAYTFAEEAYNQRVDVVDDTDGSGTIINPEGKGDVLLFNYYDVRELNGILQDTYFAIINESYGVTGTGIAAKLRFREWDKSEEVYDVDIWLSCDDVWVGLIRQDTTQDLAYIWSPDYVITSYALDGSTFTVTTPLDVRDAVTGALIGRPFRPSVIGLPNERSLYGYFEVIGEEATYCEAVDGKVTRFTPKADCPNQLAGYAYIVRVDDGVALGYNATAIANFSRNLGTLFQGPGATKPDLTDGEETIDQLEFLLSKHIVSQGYSIESSIAARFSAVLTFPTKHFHFDEDPPYSINSNTISYARGERPRGEPFEGDTSNSGETVSVYILDRHENSLTVPPGFESPPVEQEELVIKPEVAIIGLYQGSGTPALTNPRDNMGFSTGTFDSGWFYLVFDQSKELDSGDPVADVYGGNETITDFNYFGTYYYYYRGLPLLGLVIQEFANTGVGVGAAYGEALPIYFDQDISED